MKKMATLLLLAFVAQQFWAQCPDIALMSNEGQCMSVVWFFDLPNPLPDTIESEGNTYLYVDGIGISIAEAALYTMDRSITDPLECANNIVFMTGSMTVMGETCNYDGGLLPVTLVDFSAAQKGNSIEVTWETSFEYKSERFDVQRRTNAEDWFTMATVAGRGNFDGYSTYSVTDPLPAIGNNYYRLVAIDLDGNSEASAVVHAEFRPSNAVYPNPATDLLVITAEFRMFDSNGRQVAAGVAQELDVSSFSPGLYVVLIGEMPYKVTIQ